MDSRRNSESVCMRHGLYQPGFERDNHDIGAVVNSKGFKSHQAVADILSIAENLEHRAGKDAGKKQVTELE